ncbi:TonB-dependent receptor [Halosquirtibacter laminarini]|uniref:TonB-dependent receptor n=1 Tax=Halosquirtibacter laminarini TaxID=3374600 RepID=A0AC61NG90_9BACT|nr:TonB-dependent receptor [Prolixibacteraceae bacterium]
MKIFKLSYIGLLLCMLCSFVGFAQKGLVKGVVKDDQGLPLPGVTVVLEGTTTGTITNYDGMYSLKTKKNGKLVFSFIGYKSVTEPIKGRSKIDVELENDIQQIGEVVAVGYGTKSIKDVTSSIATVKAEELAKAPVANFDQALAGRMSGVQVSASDGTPGKGMQIVIRGGNSVTGDNTPLYVVDGIAMESFDPGSLSTNDIESMSILKDAAASAIYGSRAANGVFLITTKGGKVGPTRISVNVNGGVQWIPRRMDVLDPYHFVTLQEEVAYELGGTYIDNFKEHWVSPELYKDSKGTNWQDEIFRTSFIKNANVSLSGGNKSTRHYASVNFVDQEGTMINTGYQKINSQLRLNHTFSNKAKFGLNFNYNHTDQKGETISGNNRNSIIMDALTFRPVNPVIDDGLEEGIDLDDRNNLRFNPVKNLTNTDRSYQIDALRINGDFSFDLAKGLVFKTTAGFNVDTRKLSKSYGYDTYQGRRGVNGINSYIESRRKYVLTNTNTLNYNKRVGNSKWNLLLGEEASSIVSDYVRAAGANMPIDDLGADNLGMGTTFPAPKSSKTGNTMLSYFSRVNYSYKEKWLLSATFRADGSSRFTGDNKWGYFPSASVGYRMIQEPFMQSQDFISNLKLRATWGQNGNNKIGDFSAYNLMNATTSSGYMFEDLYHKGLVYTNLQSEDIRWETTTQLNFAIDLGFADERIKTTLEWYRKNTTDLLLNADMAPSTGFDKTYKNVGEIQNQGMELAINTINVKTRNFEWRTDFNISYNRNKCISLNDGQTELLTNPDWSFKYSEYQYITRVGESVGQFYGLKSDGVYTVNDFNMVDGAYVLKDGIPNNGAKVAPGSTKLVDVNKDGTINNKDRVVIGNAQPDYFGGISNNFRYKNFDFSFFFQWSVGNEILNANRVVLEIPETKTNYNYLSSVAGRYSYTNPDANTDINIIRNGNVYGKPTNGNFVSDRFIEDGSFLRLKTVQVGYQFSKKMAKKMHLSKARLYASGQNLYTWTNYSGFDPEVSVGKNGALTPGLDYSAYPTSATFTVGLEIGF